MNITIPTADGYQLFASYDGVENAKGTLIFSHGFVEYSGHFSRLARMINQAGYNLFKYDLRGHGRSTMPHGTLNSFQDFADDLNRCVTWVKEQDSTLPVFTMGFSLGGMITVLFGLLNPYAVEGQILLGPGLRINTAFSQLQSDTLDIPTFLKMMGTQGDTGIQQLLALDSPYVLRRVTRTFAIETFEHAQMFIEENSKSVTLPTLILHGKNDPMISPKYSEHFLSEISSADKSLVVLEGFDHDLLRVSRTPEVIDRIIAWCDAHI